MTFCATIKILPLEHVPGVGTIGLETDRPIGTFGQSSIVTDRRHYYKKKSRNSSKRYLSYQLKYRSIGIGRYGIVCITICIVVVFLKTP